MVPFLAVLVALQASMLFFFAVLAIKARNKARALEDFLFDLTDSKDGEPSKVVKFADTMAVIFASRIVSSFEATLRGSAGGSQKSINAAEQGQLIGANPLLGLLNSKALGKSPLALQLLQGIIGTMGNRGNHNEVVTSVDRPKFKFGA